VRKLLSFLVFVFTFIFGCKQYNDSIVAEAFHKKLYLSEVIGKIPFSTSKEDSLLFIEQYVNDWILRQTLLAHAKQELSFKDQDFSSQIALYKEQLLLNSYFQKISNSPHLQRVTKEELETFIHETKTDELPEYRDMVRLNYVKLSNPSKVYKKIKDLFFNDTVRAKSLAEIEILCADTIEYYLNSEHWFYADFMDRELPLSFSDLEKNGNQKKFDIVQNENRFLILILDSKQQLQPKVHEDTKIAESLIQQQKRIAFISNYQDSIVKKAEVENKVIRYQVPF